MMSGHVPEKIELVNVYDNYVIKSIILHAILSYKPPILAPVLNLQEFRDHQYVLDFEKLRTKKLKLFL